MTRQQKLLAHPTLTPYKPLRNQLKRNAANIQSNLGGGTHGDLGLILSDAAYALFAPGTPYIWPANLGQLPIFPAGATGPQISAIKQFHCVQLFEFNRCTNVELALERFLIQSIDNIFIHALHQQHIGYANWTTRELLDHMFNSYGRVHPDNLVTNTKQMQEPWDPNTPFENLAKQIDNSANFADTANQPCQPPIRHSIIPNNKNYCHTHGYIVADQHTSATCNGKADGHKDTATRDNTMGRSTCNKHRVKNFWQGQLRHRD
jgi:hypothetical protein